MNRRLEDTALISVLGYLTALFGENLSQEVGKNMDSVAKDVTPHAAVSKKVQLTQRRLIGASWILV
jgi:hypothetical protein